MTKAKEFTGIRFGRLVAKSVSIFRRPSGKSVRLWLCQCDCGNESKVPTERLSSGETTSCGCLQAEGKKPKHGYARKTGRHPLYSTWRGMKDRCCNPKSEHWHRYGGRGIFVCSRWANDFDAFLSDMGERPTSAHSIDRIDNDKGYSAENCRWATRKQQALNRSPRKPAYRVKIDGLSLHEVAIERGFNPHVILRKYRRGVPFDQLFIDQRGNANRARCEGGPAQASRGDDGRFCGSPKDLKNAAARRANGTGCPPCKGNCNQGRNCPARLQGGPRNA